MVSAPGMKATGKTTKSLAELVDLFPTLTELAGLQPPAGLDGVSLAPLLADPAKTVKPAAFTQHPRPAYSDRTVSGLPDAMGYSVATGTVRYTEWREWKSGNLVGAELYDHARDPHETANRIDDPKLADELTAARKALHAQFPPALPPAKR